MLKLKVRNLVKLRANHAHLLSKKTCCNIVDPTGTDQITLNSIAALTSQGHSSNISIPGQDAAATTLHTAGLPATTAQSTKHVSPAHTQVWPNHHPYRGHIAATVPLAITAGRCT